MKARVTSACSQKTVRESVLRLKSLTLKHFLEQSLPTEQSPPQLWKLNNEFLASVSVRPPTHCSLRVNYRIQ